ncbi:MAG: DUF2088 domain-containing protein [Phycisphaerae bacterium]|nr:DUF2088 domain-containing protein [Phycisphaerae bacterium]
MPRTSVRWTDNEQLSLDLPDHWQVLGRYEPRATTAIEELPARLAQMLEEPIERPAFSKVSAGAQKVALVIDDLTRPTPAGELLGPVVAALEKAGISDEQVTGVVATGLHPPISREQLLSKIGGEFGRRFKWIQNDCRELDKYAYLGTVPEGAWARRKISASGGTRTTRGLDVYVLKEVAQADLIVLFGSVSPHLQAGFGGGFKLVVPGCAHSRTIGRLHKIGLNGQVARLIGQQPAENCMRRAVEQAGQLLGGKAFSVNTLLDSSGRVCRLSVGDPQAVQEQLSLACEQKCGLAVDPTADVAIVSAFPRDYDLLQGLKCLVNTRMAARKGGILIGMMNLHSLGHLKLKVSFALPTGLFGWLLGLISPGSASAMLGRLDRELDAEAKFFIRLAVETLRRNRLLIYCPEMVRAAEKLPYVEIFDDLNRLWERTEKLLGRPRQVRVNVFAEGGTTYPRLRH